MIDILIAVDGEYLAQQLKDGSLKPGSQSSPTNLGAWQSSDLYIAMITQNSFLANDQGGSELDVKANSGDTIRWTMTTFDNNADYTAFLYAGNFNPAQSITPLTYFNMHTSLYLPSGSDPTGPVQLYHNYTYVAQGTVIEPQNKIQYTLSFQLVNNANGQVIGYFNWDPFISVSA
ncbi:hypothetical protein WH50_05985 [Pokkaliibacter plantistimulans]|uniref:Inclusion body protein n=2 Tax=Pseudomonadota TaxID=1224 RepID=A0ABX5M0Y4_9GAMM|nr:AidA/PixA family protein [Pokkaliibacter plantistimulans]PXF32147.1 hypothetical protein WH50_05985 [Pokkaliibacter plantistimulans]